MYQDKVSEMLKKYPSCKYAVSVYERHKPVPSAGIAMPSGSGAPERFFAVIGKPADMGNTSYKDYQDYLEYKAFVDELEGAFVTLTDEEQSIIKLKWMQDITLKQIAVRKKFSVETIKRYHKSALSKLSKALRFTKVPDIEEHETAKVSTL